MNGNNIVTNFFLGGLISALLTLIVKQYGNKVLFLSGYLYTAPLMFPFLLYIVSKEKNYKITRRFVKHCIFGLLISVIFIVFNYSILHYFTKDVFFLLIVNICIVISSFSLYSYFLYNH
mgnify:CR=1 FL=1